jgi:hypothetical protein
MKIASKMIIGNGIPTSQSNNPRPKPMAVSPQQIWMQPNNAGRLPEFHTKKARRIPRRRAGSLNALSLLFSTSKRFCSGEEQ